MLRFICVYKNVDEGEKGRGIKVYTYYTFYFS